MWPRQTPAGYAPTSRARSRRSLASAERSLRAVVEASPRSGKRAVSGMAGKVAVIEP